MGHQASRIESLDFLRGIAVMGMLIANLPWHAGNSMSRILDVDASSVAAWLFQYAIVDQRFMPIFCMLFGAGLLLLAEGRRDAPGFTLYFLRRMLILFGIGLAHAYLLWPGDILLTYAFCGPILLLFLRAGPNTLALAGAGFLALHIAFGHWPVLYQESYGRWLFDWWLVIGDPPMSEEAAYAGSYADLFAYNAWRNQFLQWTAMPYWRMWNALGFMLIGMALFRWGVLQAQASTQTYHRMIAGGLALGLPVLIYGLLARIGADEVVGPYLGWTRAWPYQGVAHALGCAFTALALLAGLILLYRSRPQARWLGPVKALGRMALTNYVMHSVIFVLIFAVFELWPYNTLEPDERLVWVLAVWAFQLVFSEVWLRHFRQGPLEQVWRVLAGPGPARTASG